MKAFLLAAGKGTRISRMVKAIPKSTLPIDGVPLIRITVEKLIKRNIEPIVCIGYGQSKIKAALKGIDVKYYYNPFFDVTNSIASLWFARNEFVPGQDVLVLNADVFFEENILSRVMESENEVVMLVDRTRALTGDYFFSTTDNGCIKKYGKELPIQIRTCEYVGIAKIKGSFIDKFIKRLNLLIKKQNHQLWWENILYSFADEEEKIYTMDVEGEFWSEIDYFDDYERILNYFELEREKSE